jgi:3-oxoacyl-[acyl-carrier protein] reductase
VNLGLRGKVALVAAASRGLGRAVAEELAAEGANLVICGRELGAIDRAAQEIVAATGVDVTAQAADVSDPDAVDRLVAEGVDRFGQIDILVANAGGPPAGPFESLTPAMWDAATRLTLGSALALTRAVLPGMKARRWGRIINITSVAVKQPVDGLMLSNSLRAAVTGFARTLATEVAPFGVTVNNALPGYTRTERVEQLAKASEARGGPSADAVRRGWESQIPMGRLGEAREFAALVAFLASDRASYITGTSIPVDGGWVRGLV